MVVSNKYAGSNVLRIVIDSVCHIISHQIPRLTVLCGLSLRNFWQLFALKPNTKIPFVGKYGAGKKLPFPPRAFQKVVLKN